MLATEPSAEPLARLDELAAHAAAASPFHRARLAGVPSARDEGLGALPTLSRDELIADQQAHPPFGTNLTQPLAAFPHAHQTTGTTAAPLKVVSTAEDWAWLRGRFACALARAGVRAEDRVALAFSFGPHVQFWLAYDGVRELGAMAVPLGGMESLQRLDAIRGYGATAVVCTPTYALRLAEVARARGLEGALGSVERVICTGEPGGSLPSTRSRIEAVWQARCVDHAGLTEVGPFGMPCPEHGGLHLDEDEFVCEILAPDGEPVPDGGHGELVITPLGRTGFPVVRYRTGDVVVAAGGSCPAGHDGRWLPDGIVGRTDDMVVVRGMNVFPSVIEQSLRDVDPGVGEFRITFSTDGRSMDEVKLEAELSEAGSARRLQERMRSQLGLRVRVVPLRHGVLPRADHKARRVVDDRAHAARGRG